MKNRSETGQAGKPRSGCSQNPAGRGQILSVLQVNSRSIDQKSGGICTDQADLQPIPFNSDKLLETAVATPLMLRYTLLRKALSTNG